MARRTSLKHWSVAVLLVAALGIGFPNLARGSSPGADLSISPATQSVSSGTQASYSIALSCGGVGSSSCGSTISISIPLSATTQPPMTDPSWSYSASATPANLISSAPAVVGSNLVIGIDPTVFIGGFSGTITLNVTPPNDTTWNNTSWTLNPSLDSDALGSIPADQTAATTATAKPQVSISQSTADGGSVYGPNTNVTYDLSAACTTPSSGNLFADPSLGPIKVVDTLPAGMTYVSSTPQANSVVGQVVTWLLSSGPNAGSLPTGCTSGSGGPPIAFHLTATTPNSAQSGLSNSVDFIATGPDATNPSGVVSTANAQLQIDTLATIPVGPGDGYASISKSAMGSVPQAGITSGNQYVATFPGNWDPIGTSPNFQVGMASAMYQTTVTYGLINTYQSTITDPVPCLDNPLTGSTAGYQSASVTSTTACSHPAFITQEFEVSAPPSNTQNPTNGIAVADANGWVPEYVPAGSSSPVAATLVNNGGAGGSWTYSIPAGTAAGSIILPPSSDLEVPSIQLTLFGYVDQSLVNDNTGINQLHNVATVTPQNGACNYQGQAGVCEPVQAWADLYTVKPAPALGMYKSFGSLTQLSTTSATAPLRFWGSIASPTPIAHNLIITDWLPQGMTTVSPASSVQIELRLSGHSSQIVSGAVTDLPNYLGSGRELIRITIPSSDFYLSGWTGMGFWYVDLNPQFGGPADPFTVHVAPGVYPNSAQLFLANLGSASQIVPTCTNSYQWGGGISDATFENDNSHNLAGDGQLSEDYCQNTASLTFEPPGAAFSLTKNVQGNLDSVAKGPLGIGSVSPNGTGVFTMAWTNVASDQLSNPVVYDLLPRTGDTGVSGLQSGVARGSQFTPLFVASTASSGIEIEYSTATNPCRPEVYANDTNCVNDWTTNPPSSLTSVTALRFSSTQTYSFNQGFAMTVTMRVPAADAGLVAWNSAATNASDVTNSSTVLLPAEPPKVGIETTAPGVPSNVAAQPGKQSATVSWTAPSSNGTAISSYLVTYSSDGGTTWHSASMCTGAVTSCHVTGLQEGMRYVFRVAAVNAIGTGAFSLASTPITLAVAKPKPGVITPHRPSSAAATALAMTGTPLAPLVLLASTLVSCGAVVCWLGRRRSLS